MRVKTEECGFTLTEACIATLVIGPLMVAFMSASSAVGTALDENEMKANVTTMTRGIGDQLQKTLMAATPMSLKAKPAPIVRALESDVIIVPPSSEFSQARTGLDPNAGVNEPGEGQPPEGSELITMATTLKNMGDQTHYVTTYHDYKVFQAKYDAYQKTPTSWESIEQFRPTEKLQFEAVDGEISMNATATTSARSLEFVRDAKEKLNAIDDDNDGMIDEGRLFLINGNTRTLLIDNVEVCTFTLEGQVIRLALRCCRRDHRSRVHRTTIQKRILIRNK